MPSPETCNSTGPFSGHPPPSSRIGQWRRTSFHVQIYGMYNRPVTIRLPLLSAAAQQFQGQVGLFRGRPCYRCFVGDAFDADDCDNCADLGVLGPLAAAVGSYAALLAVNRIVDVGPDQSGQLHVFDGASLKWRIVRIPADPNCRACGGPAT